MEVKTADDQMGWLAQNPIIAAINDSWASLSAKRDALELSNPGTFENVSMEVTKGVFLNNLAFTGLRADLTKIFGVSPLFQVSHAFSMGLGGPGGLPPYAFAVLYGSSRVCKRQDRS
jgi:mitochondrial import receptor subunit TOM40